MSEKNFSSRSSKKKNQAVLPTEEPAPQNTPLPSEKEVPVEENDTHEKFRDSLTPEPHPNETDITPPNLSPVLEKPQIVSVINEAPTEVNAYVGKQRGITDPNEPPPSSFNAEPPPASDNPPPPPPPGQEPPLGANKNWQATPPPNPTDAPEQPPPPPPGSGTDPFTMPTGTAEEVIQWGFGLVNYGIKEFGPYAVRMKFSKGFYAKLPEKLVTEVKSRVKTTAEKAAPRIIFTQEEIDMVKKPLAKGMNEAGVRGLTWKEELLAVSLIIMAKKATIIGEIRSENRAMADHIEKSFERYYKPEPPPKKEAAEEGPNEYHDPNVVSDAEVEGEEKK